MPNRLWHIIITCLRSMNEKRLAKLGLHSDFDLLLHLPRDYQDRTVFTPLNQLIPGQPQLITGNIVQVECIRARTSMLLCHISDGTGYVIARFFHFNKYQYQGMQQHAYIRCFGEVRVGKKAFEMIHPEYQLAQEAFTAPISQQLTPVYPTTAGITQNRLRQWIQDALAKSAALPELFPAPICERLQFPAFMEALNFVHHPPKEANLQQLQAGTHPMQQRLIFEELLAHRLSLRQLRQHNHQTKAIPLSPHKKQLSAFLKSLPFQLTNAQQRVQQEIAADLANPVAMLRLLQGDVGSGKTVMAECAALQAILAGHQVALMAPTEILAEQHYQHIQQDFTTLNLSVVPLMSKLGVREKKEVLTAIQTGKAQLVIGTQALFQEAVTFHSLALVIIDEQHRFGVEQRHALQAKGHQLGCQPHQLIMTATPIPRTLAMTQYADLDISILDELPKGRIPIQTILVSNTRREEVTARIAHNCKQGKQAYWVCPLIEESELLDCEAAEKTAEQLRQALPHLRIGLIHGRVKATDKTAIMHAFKQGEIQLLVATTVIEVGVNVPNASLMVIENAERLGLAQLHQLRGRVGRGSTESFCVLMYQTPLSPTAQSRLEMMRNTTDGFKIAEHDLQLRGPGEVLGTRQTGDIQFKIASLLRDQHLLPQIQSVADELLQNHPAAAEAIIERWIGNAKRFKQV